MIKKFHLYTALILSVLGVSLTLAIGLIDLDTTKVFAQPQATTSSSNATNPSSQSRTTDCCQTCI